MAPTTALRAQTAVPSVAAQQRSVSSRQSRVPEPAITETRDTDHPWVLEQNTLGRKQRKGEEIRSTAPPLMTPCRDPHGGHPPIYAPTPPTLLHLTVHLEASTNGLACLSSWLATGRPGTSIPGCHPGGWSAFLGPAGTSPKQRLKCKSFFFKIIFNVFLIIFCLIYQINHLNK